MKTKTLYKLALAAVVIFLITLTQANSQEMHCETAGELITNQNFAPTQMFLLEDGVSVIVVYPLDGTPAGVITLANKLTNLECILSGYEEHLIISQGELN